MMKLLPRTTLYLALGFSSAIVSAQGTMINNQCTPSGFYQNDAECFIKVRPRRRGEEETSTPSHRWTLNVTQSGDFCYRTLNEVKLWRPDANEKADLVIEDFVTDETLVTVPFRINRNEQAWPDQIIKQAGTYRMILSDGEQTTITLHQIPDYADEVTWMKNNGCEQQAERLENQMVNAGSI